MTDPINSGLAFPKTKSRLTLKRTRCYALRYREASGKEGVYEYGLDEFKKLQADLRQMVDDGFSVLVSKDL